MRILSGGSSGKFLLSVATGPVPDQRRSQEFDLGGYKLHDIEFVLGQGDKTTT